MVSLRRRLRDFPWPPPDRQLIRILHALTGVPYQPEVANATSQAN
jgi:hypothetical protein